MHVTNQHGAVLVQVAVVITALCGFSALAVDYGMLMTARSQAQAAADAGALAGATAIGFDDFGGFDYFTSVVPPAQAVAGANLVMGGVPAVDVDLAPNGSPVPPIPGFPPSPDPERIAIGMAVSVYRTTDHNNPLPTLFGRLVGIAGQEVRAKATATTVPSNASDCVWPIAIPDRWTSNPLAPSHTAFVKYAATGPPTLAPFPDGYAPPRFTPPSSSTAGSGYQVLVSLAIDPPGLLTLSAAPANFLLPLEPNRFVSVQVPNTGGSGFGSSVTPCNGIPVTIGDRLPVDGSSNAAAAISAANALKSADALAAWNPSTSRVQNSCASDAAPCAPMSPRIVVLPVFDLNRYELTRWSGGAPGATPEIQIVNLVGFFITDVTTNEIRGHLTLAPGRVVTGRPMVGYESAFLRTPVLTR